MSAKTKCNDKPVGPVKVVPDFLALGGITPKQKADRTALALLLIAIEDANYRACGRSAVLRNPVGLSR